MPHSPNEKGVYLAEEFDRLCYACRKGDVSLVQDIISSGSVDINDIDEFDYSPLILASLCGHYEVVYLLLESGAICEGPAGERCLYNALNDRIRNLLSQYDVLIAARCPELIHLITSNHAIEGLCGIEAEVLEYLLKYIYLYGIPESMAVSSPGFCSILSPFLERFQLHELSTYLVKNHGEWTDRRSRSGPWWKRAEYREGQTAFYPAHRAMLRCEYFERMFTSGFRESYWQSSPQLDGIELPVIPVMMTPEILELTLQWFYSDHCDIQIPLALDLLYAADMFFINAIKLKAASVLTTIGWSGSWSNHLLDGDDDIGFSIFDVIRAGWQLRIRRLEEFGAKFLAERLEEVLQRDTKLASEFEELIKESAARIKEREGIDTIEIVDDIQFYLSERFRMRLDDLQAETMFSDPMVDAPETSNGIKDTLTSGEIDLGTSTLKYEELNKGHSNYLDKLKARQKAPSRLVEIIA